MTHAVRQTVRVNADHSIVLQNTAWKPGQELDILVLDKSSASQPYAFLQTLENEQLSTPEDFSTSYERALKDSPG